jgi:ABC-2 type transport system ATP-binding protein
VCDVVLHNLGKRYRIGWRSRWVLKDLKLEVSSGEIVGLIGANGAGKTTLFKLMTGFISPDRGYVRFVTPHKVLGQDPRQSKARKLLAYLPENPRFPEHLSGRAVLRYLAAAEGVPRREASRRVPELLEMVALSQYAKLKVRNYSKGMLQRLAMAQCFLGQPELALLDEPMSGLDPQGRQLMARLIRELKRSGVTVIFSSHLLSDLEGCCSHLAVLKDGRATKMSLASLPEAPGTLKEYFARCAGY